MVTFPCCETSLVISNIEVPIVVTFPYCGTSLIMLNIEVPIVVTLPFRGFPNNVKYRSSHCGHFPLLRNEEITYSYNKTSSHCDHLPQQWDITNNIKYRSSHCGHLALLRDNEEKKHSYNETLK